MKNKALTISIVIPVYNEERYLKACLDSIARQSDTPNEVIVVDNNSTDSSLEIASSYGFVKVLNEKRQHQVFAQARGFNSAKSDILGRIDGDSILPVDWVKNVKEAFLDKEVVAVTGGADPFDVPVHLIGVLIFHGYMYIAGLIAGTRLIYGANAAIRKSSWKIIKAEVLMRPDIWEDYDMAFCLRDKGKVKYIVNNKVGVSFRAVHTTFAKYVSYQYRSVRTYYLRGSHLRTLLFIVLWLTTFLAYPLAYIDDQILKLRDPRPAD